MTSDTVIVGVGMVTAVGLSAGETAASVRAGMARFVESRIQDKQFEPFLVAEVPDDGLPRITDRVNQAGLTARETRMLRLAASALQECVTALPRGAPAPALTLALPEPQPGRELQGEAFLAHLARQTDAAFDVERSSVSGHGRAGGLAAIGRAAEMIGTGQARFAIAGGVDTYRDLYVLGTLDLEKRVQSSANLDGFIPGEGAAFLLLASLATVGAGPPTPIARLSPVSHAVEAGHLYSEEPYRGEGLAQAVQQAVAAAAASAPIRDVYSSMNGERYWAKEWGVARIRAAAAFADDHGMHHPADCFGDLGAAVGPAMTGLGALGIRAGYRRSPILVYASSDTGGRAALMLAQA